MDAYCPPLMVPLLRALSVLQNAVRTGRTAHFQPSTAYIISSVRAILTEIGCLPRDADILRKHPPLAKERKRILSDLASLVTQAKQASEEELSEQQRGVEVEGMIRGSGQLFAHVRGLLAIAVQCGVNVQPSSQAQGSEHESLGVDGWGSQEGTLVHHADPVAQKDGLEPHAKGVSKITDDGAMRLRQREATATPRARARSMSDLHRGRMQADSGIPPIPPKAQMQSLGRAAGKQFASGLAIQHKSGQPSVSSISSSSSVSSGDSLGTPPTPTFPSGPSTIPEVMEALRFTHDHYLSTIAAFIGHAHSHSRTSHASSTGHMYDLVREVVEMVCKLLTIVDAVLRHPDISVQRVHDLRAAKEGLYNVTSTLADAVRQLTTAPLPDVTEEEEKATLLRSATNALKAGSDCVNAVKKCLQRPASNRPFIIELPGVSELDSAAFTPSKFSHARQKSNHLRVVTNTGSSALRQLRYANGVEGDDEDLTIQAQTASFAETPTRPDHDLEEQSNSPLLSALSLTTPVRLHSDADSSSPTATSSHPRPSLEAREREVGPSTPESPVSLLPTEDGTTWEGSLEGRRSLEEKLRNGELPEVPEPSFPSVPPPPPMSWLMSYDHALEDVAYNSEGQLVGATLSALVERMTPHDVLVDPPFAAVFFLTFRQFVTPVELLEALIARYNLLPPSGLAHEDMLIWQQRKGLPVRLRVANVVKTWLESYWRPELDAVILPALTAFTRDALGKMFPVPSQRIMELIKQRVSADETTRTVRVERVRDAGIPLNPPSGPVSEMPAPKIHKNIYASLRNKNYKAVAITDFEPLELARQLTLMECNLYCAIQPEEVLETGQSGGAYPGHVKAVTSLSTVITGWVAESILNEPDTKKRTALVKFFVKVADVSLIRVYLALYELTACISRNAPLCRITARLDRSLQL